MRHRKTTSCFPQLEPLEITDTLQRAAWKERFDFTPFSKTTRTRGRIGSQTAIRRCPRGSATKCVRKARHPYRVTFSLASANDLVETPYLYSPSMSVHGGDGNTKHWANERYSMLRAPKCPVCSHPMNNSEHSRFFTWISRRRISTCPTCESRLVCNKWPWRLMCLGALLLFGPPFVLLAFSVFQLRLPYQRLIVTFLGHCMWIGCITFVIAALMTNLELDE